MLYIHLQFFLQPFFKKNLSVVCEILALEFSDLPRVTQDGNLNTQVSILSTSKQEIRHLASVVFKMAILISLFGLVIL